MTSDLRSMHRSSRATGPGLALIGCCTLLGAAACAVAEPDDPAPAGSVVVISRDVGEVLAASARTEQVSFGLDLPADARLAYANVDHLGLSGLDARVVARLAALESAKAQRIPILLESNEWDVPRLHGTLALLFPDQPVDQLANVAVLADWDPEAARWRLTDTTPAEMVDYLGNDDLASAARRAEQLEPDAPAVDTVADAVGTQRAHWLLPFAEAAYDSPLTVTAAGAPTAYAGTYNRGWSQDVVKIYRRTNSGIVNCVVTWRGTTSIWTSAGLVEWLGDLSSVSQARPFYLPLLSPVRVGSFWNLRLANQRAGVNQATRLLGCGNVHITGHSLGGAMAQLHGHYYAFGSGDGGLPLASLRTVVAWNPARVGNSYFKSAYRSAVIAGGRASRVYCRNGDPVRAVPPFLEHTGAGDNGCDVNGVNRARILFWQNHNLPLWDQCESSTSC